MHRAVVPALLLACSERSAVVAMQRPAELEPAAGERAVAVELAAGSMHTCARMRDATVQCWGEGRWGQLGDGAREDQDPPVRVPGLAGVVDIDAEGDRTCAVLADGAVQCWGRPGADGRASPVPRSEDEVWTVPRPVAAWTRVQQIALSRDHDCALSDGLVRCLGANDRGQLGDGSTSPSASPVTPGALGRVDEIAVGEAFSCARVTGDVWCWGLNDRGQCGSDGPGTLGSPTRVAGLRDVRALALGQAHACALLGDDGLRCWGDNFQGQLGDGSGLRRRALVTVPVDHVRRIAAHHRQTAVVLDDGTVRGWGGDLDRPILWRECPKFDTSDEYTVLDGERVPTFTFTYCPTPTPVPGLTSVTQVALGGLHACALDQAGQVTCWGSRGSRYPRWGPGPWRIDLQPG